MACARPDPGRLGLDASGAVEQSQADLEAGGGGASATNVRVQFSLRYLIFLGSRCSFAPLEAIADKLDAFETTLGGETMTRLLVITRQYAPRAATSVTPLPPSHLFRVSKREARI